MAHAQGRTTAEITGPLAEWVAGLRLEEVPAEVVGYAKLALLDTLGCGLFGSTLPWGQTVVRFARRLGRGGEATVWGDGCLLPAANAALANGTLVHAFEMDDLHARGVLHPGSVTATAAFALAERRERGRKAPVEGRRVLEAIVAGYEVGARVGLACGYAKLKKGFHPAATTGVFCAAAAASRILNLNAEATHDALGTAGTQAAGLMASQYGSMVKRMHMGLAAQSGIYGADLAAMGFRGVRGVLEAPYGGFLGTLVGEAAEPAAILDGLGERYEMLGVGFKIYPSCGSSHTTIDALLAIRERCPDLSPDAVESVEIHTTTAVRDHVGWPYVPDTVTSAQMNLPFTAATLLRDGALTVESFADHRLRDPELVSLAGRVTVLADPELDAMGRDRRHTVRVAVLLNDGRRFEESRTHGKGTAKNPVSPEELRAKFADLAGRVVGDGRAAAIREMVEDLEQLPAITPLADAMVGPEE